jgi:NAD(P)H-flavin reductase
MSAIFDITMPPITCRAILDRIDSLSYNVRGFRFRLLEPSTLEFQPGQFMILNVPKGGEVVKRAYSIASPPHETGILEFCIQHLEGGAASAYLWQLKEGDKVSLSGPHGRFLLKEPFDYDPVFIATGTGVAPFRAMIKHLLHRGVPRGMWLLFGCRYEHAILYHSEFRSLAALRHNLHYVPIVSRPKAWDGAVGHVQDLFKKYVTDYSNRDIYVCGWLEVVKAICMDLEALGVPKEKLHYEEWS